ncbi:MAG: SMP-30/gluconolactonase/LRE family protein [Sphingomonadales bacterium]|nr:SMP-30/gluconolactonase/LRE family protein [Sphingomonadales bacterium]
MTTVRTAFDAGNYLGETPVWSVAEQALWWVNCEEPSEIHRWHPGTGQHDAWPMPQRVGGFVLKAGGGLLVALYDGLYDWAPGDDLRLRARSPFPAHVALHECACDRQGRFWIGGFDRRFPADRGARDAAICRLDGDRLVPVIPGIAVANALAFSPDGGTLYVSDSPTRTVEAYDLDPATGAVANRRRFLSLGEGEGFVDGATVDAAGGYWLANVAAGRLRRYLPDGTLDRIVELPFSAPTKPAFGGGDLRTLYITSTCSVPQQFKETSVANGAIFALEAGNAGLPEPLLAG